MNTTGALKLTLIGILASLSFDADAAYNKLVDKTLCKSYRDVTYIPYGDCYLVTSKSDKVSRGVCDADGKEVVPALFKKCSFEQGADGHTLVFAMGEKNHGVAQVNRVYLLPDGEVVRLDNGEPQLIEGKYITSYLKPVYDLRGNVVLDCQHVSTQPVRWGKSVAGYKVTVREQKGSQAQEEVWVCDGNFAFRFSLDGPGYMWKVEPATAADGSLQWVCVRNNGSADLQTLRFTSEGQPMDAASDLASAPKAKVTQPTVTQPTVSPAPVASATPARTAPSRTAPAAQQQSDVDVNITPTSQTSPSSFAILICNEEYSEVASVPYAVHDGEIMSKYCRDVLGIPSENIRLVKNATLNQIKRQLHWLRQISEAYGGEAKVIFYYSGHGLPDEKSKDAYLIPSDGFPADMSTNLKLDDLYTSLASMPFRQVVMLMDACFSGARRDNEMMVAARGVAIKPRRSEPGGNTIVLSAAQADETAYAYDDKRHGMFTYFLLKKLKESREATTLGELSDYVTDQVKKASLVQNDRIQTPSTTTSPSLSSTWRSLTF